jgi:hypothetical protein
VIAGSAIGFSGIVAAGGKNIPSCPAMSLKKGRQNLLFDASLFPAIAAAFSPQGSFRNSGIEFASSVVGACIESAAQE